MGGPCIGVIVPCRNEAAVIERKLENLAGLEWPAASGPHRIVIVDDGSTDETAAFGRAACADLFGADVHAVVVPNRQSPGKPGAIAEALDELAGQVDLVCLSDCDVVFEPAALRRVAEAFSQDARLAMATGEQAFVSSLAEDGSCSNEDGGPLVAAGSTYDRWTAWVRRLESRCGMLFSVHGQLLAWRAALNLRPTPGIAADDLDLMLQARASDGGRGRVAQVRGAVFYEVRAPAGEQRKAQALRRARAYVQFLGHPRIAELTSSGGVLRRMQGAFYRWVPLAAPQLAFLSVPLSVFAGVWFGGLAGLLVVVGFWLTPVVWRFFALMRVIADATRSQARGDLGDRWETARH